MIRAEVVDGGDIRIVAQSISDRQQGHLGQSGLRLIPVVKADPGDAVSEADLQNGWEANGRRVLPHTTDLLADRRGGADLQSDHPSIRPLFPQ